MKKKLIILSSIITILVLVMSVSVFAYFQITSNTKTVNINHDFKSDIIEVDEFDDLYDSAKEKKYNDNLDVEELNNASRKTLKLIKDVVLYDDLFITSNVSFDLNGYKLYLNGHNMVFTYNYYGTTEIYSNTASGIIIPNEVDAELHEVDGGAYGHIEIMSKNNVLLSHKNILVKDIDGTSLTLSNYIKELPYSPKYIAYDVYNMVSDALANDYMPKVSRLSYQELDSNPDISTVNNLNVFDSKLFIPDFIIGLEPFFDEYSPNDTVSFVNKDIDLPLHYLNDTDVEIEYYSSDEGILDNYGRVIDKTQNTMITLTVAIKYNGQYIATCDFNLFVFDETSSAKSRVVKACLYSYLEAHYDTDEEYFRFEREVVLPKSIYGVNITYLPYRVSTSDEAIALFDGDSTKYLSLGPANVVSIDDYYDSFIPTNETSALGMSFAGENHYIKVHSSNLIVNNETSIARSLMNDWYGGTIELEELDVDNHIYESKTLNAFEDIDTSVYPITALSYEIINDNYELYQLDDETGNRKLLSVRAGKIPENFVQTAILSVDFTIYGKNVNLQLNITVKTPSEDTQNAFLPYYTYYDELIKANYNNYISKSFEVPFAYNNNGPIVVYDLVVLPDNYETLADQELPINTTDTNIFTIKLYYNKAVQHTFTFKKATSYQEELDEFLGTNETKRAAKLKEILAYGDAKYIFELNPDSVASENVRFGLVYNYKVKYTTPGWITFCKNSTEDEQIVTKLTIAGILKLNIDVFDETFYEWIYDNFNTSGDTYTEGDYVNNGKYILIDALNQNISVDAKTDSTLASVTDFRGLKYLTGTRVLRLVDENDNGLITDKDTAITIAREIAEMTNLEELDLTNCTGFTDGKDVKKATEYDNDSISRFVKLRNLKILNMNGCNVILFNFLENMTWLNEVHIVNQVIYSEKSYNNFYGNTGIVNYQVFSDLTDAGVRVYTTTQGTSEILFENEKSVNDYTRIKNGIVYQSILKTGIELSNVYADFTTNPDDYHLDASYNIIGEEGTLTVVEDSRRITFRTVLYELTTDTEVDATKTYYVKSTTAASGYSKLTDPSDDDLYRCYEKLNEETAKRFEVVYQFTLSDGESTNITINLSIKFNIERY
ncbi:MAG: hypothetical protein IJU60_06265 [Acholeplasmatales bacterium]|nr:hypothetical protein [Acholeplasmatales bacterium]